MNALQSIPLEQPNSDWCGVTPHRLADSLGDGWRCVRVATDACKGDQVTLVHIDGRTATAAIKEGKASFAIGAQSWTIDLEKLTGNTRQFSVVAQEVATVTVHPVIADSPMRAAQAVQQLPTHAVLETCSPSLGLEGLDGMTAVVGHAADVPLCFQVFEGVNGGEPDPLLTLLMVDQGVPPIECREIGINQIMQGLSYLHALGRAANEGPGSLQAEYERLEPSISQLFVDLDWREAV